MMAFITNVAYAALALLVAVVAIYFSVRLLGKLAKFVIILVIVALVLWLIFAENSILRDVISIANDLKTPLTV